MASGLQVRRQGPNEVLQSLDAALDREIAPHDPIVRELTEAVRDTVTTLRRDRDWHLLAGLRQKESLLLLEAGLVEQALQSSLEAWQLVQGRLSGAMQALVLTQLAACLEARGDLRGAVRAARRAEALAIAECGDALPQSLAVRAQLVRLLEKSGRDVTLPRRRLDRTIDSLREEVRPRAEREGDRGDDERRRRDGSRSHRARRAHSRAVFQRTGARPGERNPIGVATTVTTAMRIQ